MPTRNVVITDHQADLIERLVKSGHYQNASEVLRDGLRLVETRAKEDELKLNALRAAIDEGLADSARGEYVTFKTKAEMNKYLKKLANKAMTKTKVR